MIVINCHFKSDTQDMNEFFKILCDEGLVAGSRADHGNAGYDFYVNTEDNHKMVLIEKWETVEDLTAHSETELFQKFRPICKEHAVKSRICMYEE